MKKALRMGVSPGIGIGRAFLLEKINPVIPQGDCSDRVAELIRFEQSISKVAEETQEMIVKARESGQDSKADIMEAYAMLLDDSAVTNGARELIQDQGRNAVRAAQEGLEEVASMFESMDDDYMRERAADIRDIQRRFVGNLLGIVERDITNLPEGTVIVAEDLSTSDTAKMDMEHVAGILTSVGGMNSHASIIARNYGIPAIAAMGSNDGLICEGEEVVLDGTTGEIISSPEANVLAEFKIRLEMFQSEKKKLEKFRNQPSVTADGKRIEVCANIGLPSEVGRVLDATADGIGLFRSEFLYMDSGSGLPDEQTQYEAYRAVVLGMSPHPVIIRTLDIGGDKALESMRLDHEENPFLGYRAIRICLDRPALFKTQLRALLRASVHGNLKIMFPMISSVEELRQAKTLVDEAQKELCQEGIAVAEKICIGIMIEVPSAAVMARELARECDFFSIGTNDLIQYTTAVDRGNQKVAGLYSQYHPAILRLISYVINAAHEADIPCGMCGEAGGDPLMIAPLVGMGIDEISMSAGSVLRARSILSTLTMDAAQECARKVVACATRDEVLDIL